MNRLKPGRPADLNQTPEPRPQSLDTIGLGPFPEASLSLLSSLFLRLEVNNQLSPPVSQRPSGGPDSQVLAADVLLQHGRSQSSS
jgi:hypothetical protein